MAKQITLNDRAVERLKYDGDSDNWYTDKTVTGLMVSVGKKGAKTFYCRVTVAGKIHRRKLGVHPDLDYPSARASCEAVRAAIRNGAKAENVLKGGRSKVVDLPTALNAKSATVPTFEEAAKIWLKNAKLGEKERSTEKTEAAGRLERHAFPAFGYLPVDQITWRTLMPFYCQWADTMAPTFKRLKSDIERIFDNLLLLDIGDLSANPASWSGPLKMKVGEIRKGHKEKPHFALPVEEAHDFFIVVKERADASEKAISAYALMFLMLTGCRSSEVTGLLSPNPEFSKEAYAEAKEAHRKTLRAHRRAKKRGKRPELAYKVPSHIVNIPPMTWSEVDFKKETWTIQGNRTKNGQLHVIPLSSPALTILKKVQLITGTSDKTATVFPNIQNPDKPFNMLSNGALSNAVKATGLTYQYATIERHKETVLSEKAPTVHGMRSTMSDFFGKAQYSETLISSAIAHTSARDRFDGNLSAYFRSTLVEERRPMMQAWADFLTSGKVPQSVVDPELKRAAY